ncbi:MAG TPA: apolipoprotein N-acyltransferase [Steroidobacteraceae bacterium]|nr:apolipoprotein N-acyltransferase [Steroidobacteraceae bacterium]
MGHLRYALAAAAGAALAAAFDPLGWWPLALICPAALIALWQDTTPRSAAWTGLWFNLGTFLAGIYWVYVGLHAGGAPLWMALFVGSGLVGAMALYGALTGYIVGRWLPARGALRWMAGIPAAWVLIEWWRGWFLTGFGWLSLGYTQTDTWLGQAFAPILGEYGISALLAVGAGALVTLIWGRPRERGVAVAALALPWIIAWPVRGIEWTHAVGKPVGVAIVQGAVPQDEKWLEANRDATLELYRNLTLSALGTPVIVWPEAALPDLANDLTAYLVDLDRDATRHGSSILLGAVRAEGEDVYYNSVLSLGTGIDWYDKHHLVPFAEFFPVPGFIRSWLRIMSLPYSDFTRGAAHQQPLPADGLRFATTICYEDVYGSYELPLLGVSDALVTVTNDAWFAHTAEHAQHLQIARLRALEDGRDIVRAANDGISAVIGSRGQILARAPEYRPFVLKAAISARRGLTPYAYYGNWLIIGLAATTLALAAMWSRILRASAVRGAEPAAARVHRMLVKSFTASEPRAVRPGLPEASSPANPRSPT